MGSSQQRIGIANLERETSIRPGFGGERFQMLLRHRHDFMHSPIGAVQAAGRFVERQDFRGELAYLEESCLGDCALVIRHIQAQQ